MIGLIEGRHHVSWNQRDSISRLRVDRASDFQVARLEKGRGNQSYGGHAGLGCHGQQRTRAHGAWLRRVDHAEPWYDRHVNPSRRYSFLRLCAPRDAKGVAKNSTEYETA